MRRSHPSPTASGAWVIFPRRQRSRGRSPAETIETSSPAPRESLVPEIERDLARRVAAAGTGDSAAGMHARAAQIKSADGRPIVRQLWRWPHEERLVQRSLRLVDLALGTAVLGLHIARRKHARDDRRSDIDSLFGHLPHRDFAEGSTAVIVPLTVSKRIRCILHVHIEAMPALRSLAAVRYLEVRRARDAAMLRIVVGALEIVERRRHGQPRETRGVLERKIDARGDAPAADVLYCPDELGIKPAGIHQLEERAPRIGARDDERSGALFPALQHDFAHAACAHDDPGDADATANLDARKPAQH